MDRRADWDGQGKVESSGGRALVRRLIREPLIHFLVLGLLLFVAFDVVGGNRGIGNRRIIIDDGVVGDIVQRYAGVWGRPPTPEEIRALLDSHVEEEILYREGVAQGLLENDPVIRRRVRQKADILAEETSRSDPPSEADLQSWFKANAVRYAEPPVLSFTQVMFDPVRLGTGTGTAIAAAKARLAGGSDPATVGEATLLPAKLDRVSADRVAQDFGEDFALAIKKLPVGSWQGPVRSGFGLHLVRVTAREPGRRPVLDEVRIAVERDWENERRQRAAEAYYKELRRDYDVVIKADLPAAAQPQAAEK